MKGKKGDRNESLPKCWKILSASFRSNQALGKDPLSLDAGGGGHRTVSQGNSSKAIWIVGLLA